MEAEPAGNGSEELHPRLNDGAAHLIPAHEEPNGNGQEAAQQEAAEHTGKRSTSILRESSVGEQLATTNQNLNGAG
ncbi:hypothetical protein NHF46_09630 [Arthrobacter alpinus]|nr:hypothetical protein [Arthrobacter alpinus]